MLFLKNHEFLIISSAVSLTTEKDPFSFYIM